MFRFKNLSILFFIFLLSGCQVLQGERSVPQYSKDAAITTKVKHKLAQTSGLSATKIHVETDKQTVQLSGFINTANQRKLANSVAHSVKGVKQVKNDLITYKDAHSQKARYKAKRALTYS